MGNKQRKMLSITERAMLDVINKFPGLTPVELGQHMQGIIKPDTASSVTSRLVDLHKVNRSKVPMTSTYRYYPLNHTLPNGVTQWDNVLVKKVPFTRTSKMLQGQMNNEHVQAAVGAMSKEPPKDERQMELPLPPSKAGILLTIEYGNNQSLTVSLEDARRIWEQLHAIFNK